MKINLQVNGEAREVETDEDTPLLWVLRDSLGLTGTKFGCGVGACGACTVHVDGAPARSCSVAAASLQGSAIVTIEGLETATGHRIQRAWIEHQVPQCGYCQSGMIMAAVALMERTPQPSDADIDEHMTNLCRCGTYERVRRAIHSVASATTLTSTEGSIRG